MNTARSAKLFAQAAITCFSILSLNLVAIHGGNSASAQAQFDMNSVLNVSPQGLITGLSRGQLPPVSTGITGVQLPVVSTGSVDINTCDMPFLRSNGGSGAFPGPAGGPSAGNPGAPGRGPVPAPALPPGYVGMTNSHSGDYMGYIPPGGNLYDWSRGAYGLTPGQEGEAAYLWSSGQLASGFNNGMFDGTGISLGGP